MLLLNSGLIREDNSVKTSYLELKRLIKEEWHTEYTARTDSEGIIDLAGFKGQYTVNADGREALCRLSDDTCKEISRIVLK